jgi:hypothetical protein
VRGEEGRRLALETAVEVLSTDEEEVDENAGVLLLLRYMDVDSECCD